MSMCDKSHCSTFCNQEDCERNLNYNKPQTQYYSVSAFDIENCDHKNCEWKIKKEG